MPKALCHFGHYGHGDLGRAAGSYVESHRSVDSGDRFFWDADFGKRCDALRMRAAGSERPDVERLG